MQYIKGRQYRGHIARQLQGHTLQSRNIPCLHARAAMVERKACFSRLWKWLYEDAVSVFVCVCLFAVADKLQCIYKAVPNKPSPWLHSGELTVCHNVYIFNIKNCVWGHIFMYVCICILMCVCMNVLLSLWGPESSVSPRLYREQLPYSYSIKGPWRPGFRVQVSIRSTFRFWLRFAPYLWPPKEHPVHHSTEHWGVIETCWTWCGIDPALILWAQGERRCLDLMMVLCHKKEKKIRTYIKNNKFNVLDVEPFPVFVTEPHRLLLS